MNEDYDKRALSGSEGKDLGSVGKIVLEILGTGFWLYSFQPQH